MRRCRVLAGFLGLSLSAGGLMESYGAKASDGDRIAELERKIDVLSGEIEKQRHVDVIPEPGESKYGLGPAASKIYHKEQGISIGGYGEALYQNFDGDKTDDIDFLRGVLYFGNKFNDRWVFNSEFEFEHANVGEDGDVSVEFAYLDYLYSPAFNFRAGLLLVPMGFLNELHEPTVYLSARRPDVENRIIPSTWRENGAGFFGSIGTVSYKAYVVNGFDATGFTPSGVRGGRQKGSNAKANELAAVGRLDWNPANGVVLGGSAYHGNSGQDIDVDVATTIYEAHLGLQKSGWSFRMLGAVANLDDVTELNRVIAGADLEEGAVAPADADIESIGEEMLGWYAELGYDLLTLASAGESSLTPFVRYEQYDTQSQTPAGFKKSGKNEIEVITVGLNYKPIDEIVFKCDYQFYEDEADSLDDQFNLAMGYVF